MYVLLPYSLFYMDVLRISYVFIIDVLMAYIGFTNDLLCMYVLLIYKWFTIDVLRICNVFTMDLLNVYY